LSDNNLTVLASGTFVRGDLFSEDVLVIEGGVEGNIVGARVIVKARGWVHGDLSCRSLSIEPGGVVDGAVKVATKPSLPGRAEPEALPEGDDSYSLPMNEGAEVEGGSTEESSPAEEGETKT
jgi:cytoskeletal protein CcmA (bactofilin family)